MIEKDYLVIRKYIRQYYLKSKSKIWIPPPLREREFGFVVGTNKIMVRHKGFETDEAVKNFLINESPLDAYHSAAIYENPTASMEEKGLKGADLFFDIDADHVDPECGKDSHVWVCNSCNEAGFGLVENCSRCKKSVSYVAFPNKECIEAARKETERLILVLTEEFGLPPEDIRVHYSGNRGFHVYVGSEDVRGLSQDARKEMIDYISNPSPEINLLVVRGKESPKEVYMPKAGLPGRVIEEFEDIITNGELLVSLFGQRTAGRVSKESTKILSELGRGRLGILLTILGRNNLKKLFEEAINRVKIRVDPVVTIDLHRLVRMPGSINSKTGLPKLEVDLYKVDAREMLASVEQTGNSIKVMVKAAPKIELGGDVYGPYEDIIVDLPLEVGALLILRGVAEVIT